MAILRTILVNLVFLYLLFRGFSFINRENKVLALQYSSAWNSSMQSLNDIQVLVTGEKNFDFTQKNVTCEKCEKKLMGNLGMFFVFAALSVQYRPVLRLVSILGFFALFFQYGKNTSNFTTQDYFEKYQHFIMCVLFLILRFNEPQLYDEKSLKKIVGEVCKELEEQNEALRNKKSSKKNKNKKENEQQTQEEKILNQSPHMHIKQEYEQAQDVDSDEYQEEYNKKLKQPAKTSNQYYSDEEDEETQEEKRKYQVDDDGFSVVPKKITKKVQETRKNATTKKKQKNDI